MSPASRGATGPIGTAFGLKKTKKNIGFIGLKKTMKKTIEYGLGARMRASTSVSAKSPGWLKKTKKTIGFIGTEKNQKNVPKGPAQEWLRSTDPY